MENTRINTNAEYLILTSESDLLNPIKAMVYSFCKRFKTCESMDIFELTKTGKTIQSQNYYDYIQSVYAELLEACLNHPNDNFQDTLFTATKKGLYKCYKSFHGRYSYIVKDKETGEEKRVFETVKTDDINNGVYDNILVDTYQNTEYKAIQNVFIDSILDKHSKTDKHRRFAELYAIGYTLEEIGNRYNVSKSAVKKALSRMA